MPALVLLISMFSIVSAENGGWENNKPDFTLQAVHQEYKETIREYPMLLTLTNNTDEAVTVTGDENDQLTIYVKPNPNPMAEKEPFKFDLFEESIVVAAGETKEIARIPTGGTDCWNAFYHPKLVEDMDVEININAVSIIFYGVYYGITGIIRNPLYLGKIISTDNEDGTATLNFTLTAYEEEFEFVCSDYGCQVIPTDPVLIGPKTGLKKSDFSIQKEGHLLGEIIKAEEIAEAEYELVWQHEAGEYEGILLNTASNYGDFFVCDDTEGFLNYTFIATITHTEDPVVIEHEDASLETAGATNIPKIVNLFFKEVEEEEIDEETMEVIEGNVKEISVKKEIVHIYDIALLLDGEEIQPNGPVKITIPLDEKMKKYVDLKVVYITDTGELIEVEALVTDDEISFITEHFSYYAILGTPETEEGGQDDALDIIRKVLDFFATGYLKGLKKVFELFLDLIKWFLDFETIKNL